MVKALHRAGIEVILDVVYNHTGEGNHLGPDAVASAASTTPRYYRLAPDDRAPLRRLHRLRQQLNMLHPRTCSSSIIDSLRYWVLEMHVDGFRFDLAPRARARAARGRPARRRSSTSCSRTRCSAQVKLIAEPWDLGRGRLPGRELPAGLGRVERPVPRQRARASGAATPASWPSSPRASRARATSTQASGRRAVRERQLRHLPRRLHAARPRQLRAQAQRGERRGQPRRRRRQLQPQLGRRGPDRRRRDRSRMRERMQRNLLATLAVLAGRADAAAAATSSAARSAATTTPTARTTRSAGSTGTSTRPVASCSRSRARRARRSVRDNPVLRRRSFFTGAPVGDGSASDLAWLRPDGGEMTEQDWHDARGHVARHADARATRPTRSTSAAAGWCGRHAAPAAERRAPLAPVHAAAARRSPGAWQELLNTAPGRASESIRRPGVNLVAHSLMVLRYRRPR